MSPAPRDSEVYDVIIVGGGLAGITAARELTEQGSRTLMLEARDRLGGRAWSRDFTGRDFEIAMGGTYVVKSHFYQSAFREIERYNLELETPPAPASMVTLLGDQRLDGRLPIPPQEWKDLERALFAFRTLIEGADVETPIEQQITRDADISCADFLASLNLPERTHDYLKARFQAIAVRDASEFSMGILAHQLIGADNSIFGYLSAPVSKLAGGTRALYEAIWSDADIEVRLSSPVTAVDQSGDTVVVSSAGGQFQARACIVATPIMLWPSIEFTPPLPPAKVAGPASNPLNSCQKVWAVVQDAPADVAGIGNSDQAGGFVMVMPDRMLDDGQLMVGFAPHHPNFSSDSHDDVERAFQEYLPGCKVIDFDSHDWVHDAYTLGGWMAPGPGYISDLAAEMRANEGRLVFATADIARHGMQNLSGAIHSGHDAAAAVTTILSYESTHA